MNIWSRHSIVKKKTKTFKWLLIAFKIKCQLFSATFILMFHDLVLISVSGIIYHVSSFSILSLYNLCYYNKQNDHLLSTYPHLGTMLNTLHLYFLNFSYDVYHLRSLLKIQFLVLSSDPSNRSLHRMRLGISIKDTHTNMTLIVWEFWENSAVCELLLNPQINLMR